MIHKTLTCKFRKFAFGVFSVLSCFSGFANDGAISVSAGGIEFKKHTEIEMRQEILEISPDQVKVKYQFYNRSPKSISEKISFPLPVIEYGRNEYHDLDPLFHMYEFIENSAKVLGPSSSQQPLLGQGSPMQFFQTRLSMRGLSDFSVRVDGNSLRPDMGYLSLLPDGRNISEELLKMGIPLSKTYLLGWESSPALEKFPHWLEALKSKNYVNKENQPLWKNQVIYVWEDHFPPQKVHTVEHSYRPGAGFSFVDQYSAENMNKIKKWENPKRVLQTSIGAFEMATSDFHWEDYCLSDSAQAPSQTHFENQLRSLLKRRKKQPLTAREVRYVLKTGANWAGPIRSFQLSVKPRKNELAFFCWKGKPATKTSIVETDFTPNEDLRVIFISLE